jgi:hypothetical protein
MRQKRTPAFAFALTLVLCEVLRAQQTSRPTEPDEAIEFLRAVKREIAKVKFAATEKKPTLQVSFRMSTAAEGRAITGYKDLDAKGRNVFENVRRAGLLSGQYELTFVPKSVREHTRKSLDANGNELKLNGQPIYEQVYLVDGEWRACSRPWQNYVPDSPNPAAQTETAARRRKDEMEIVQVRCTVPKHLASLEDLQGAQQLTVTGSVEDWAFRGFVYFRKAEFYSARYARTMEPTLSELHLHADSLEIK